jgi:hypothetical protein
VPLTDFDDPCEGLPTPLLFGLRESFRSGRRAAPDGKQRLDFIHRPQAALVEVGQSELTFSRVDDA